MTATPSVVNDPDLESLTAAEKRQLVTARLSGFAHQLAEALLNREVMQASGEEGESLTEVNKQVGVYRAAVKVHRDALSVIPAK